MSLAITAEQRDLRATIRQLLQDTVPLSAVREVMSTPAGHSERGWSGLRDLGVLDLAIPEQFGGAGVGYQELALVFEECGRALVPTPLLASVGLAAPLLVASQDDAAQQRFLPGIGSGESIATVAWIGPGQGWDADGTSLTLTADGSRWLLSGDVAFVLDGASADLLLAVAYVEDDAWVVAVDCNSTGVTMTPTPTLDQTRPMASFAFDQVDVTPVGERGEGVRLLAEALDVARTLLAAEMVGGAQACLDMSVEYAKLREQFDRPIGSFQAIKHKCAEVLVALEGARSASRYGAWVATESAGELAVVAPLAKAAAAEAYFRAAAENVQIHGGIGFTWEHDAHLYFKRAKSSLMLFGDVGAERRRLADRIGI